MLKIKITKLFTNQKGATLVLVALCLTVFMGFSAIIVDVGALYKARREMVTAADAAALAGARELELSEGVNVSNVSTDETGVLYDYAVRKNKADSCTLNQVIPIVGLGTQLVDVTATRKVELTFAKVLGFSNKDVSATAVASWGYYLGDTVFPFYYDYDLYNTKFNESGWDATFHMKSDVYGGNWGIFDVTKFFPPQTPNNISPTLYEAEFPLDPQIVPNDGINEKSKPGDVMALVNGLTKESSTPYGRLVKYYQYTHQDLYPGAEKISMVGLIPIVEVLSPPGTNGPLDMEVVGFEYFEIQDVIEEIKKVDGVYKAYGSKYATNKVNYDDISESSRIEYPYDGTNQNNGTNYIYGTIIGRFRPDWVDGKKHPIIDSAGGINQNGVGERGIQLIK